METTLNQRKVKSVFIWRVSALHTIAYFIAGLFALTFMGYSEEFGIENISKFMLPVDHWQVAIGLGLQIIRGVVIALVLWPFKETILSNKGWIKLAFLVLGLSYFSTIGPGIGSFDGYILTSIPLKVHLSGIPETLIYVFLFASLLDVWYKHASRGMNFTVAIFVGFILLMSLFGILDSLGVIRQR